MSNAELNSGEKTYDIFLSKGLQCGWRHRKVRCQLQNDLASYSVSRLEVLRGGGEQEGYPTVVENPSIHALLHL